MARLAAQITVCVLSVLAGAAVAASTSGARYSASVAGLTAELLGAETAAEVERAVSTAAGLSDVQIANALGRAMARKGSTAELRRGMALIEGEGQTLDPSVMASFRAGEMTAGVLMDYRGLGATPLGGSGGSAGGRNE